MCSRAPLGLGLALRKYEWKPSNGNLLSHLGWLGRGKKKRYKGHWVRSKTLMGERFSTFSRPSGPGPAIPSRDHLAAGNWINAYEWYRRPREGRGGVSNYLLPTTNITKQTLDSYLDSIFDPLGDTGMHRRRRRRRPVKGRGEHEFIIVNWSVSWQLVNYTFRVLSTCCIYAY